MKKKWLAVFAVLAAVAVGIAFPAVALLALILAFIGGILYLAWSMNKKEKGSCRPAGSRKKSSSRSSCCRQERSGGTGAKAQRRG